MSSFFESDSLQLGYGNQVVISDLKISLESSKNYEIIGKNGSGKTTLLMCISNNFIGNTFNSDIKRNNNTLMEIGSMPSLIPMLSLIENINYFLFKENIKEKWKEQTGYGADEGYSTIKYNISDQQDMFDKHVHVKLN